MNLEQIESFDVNDPSKSSPLSQKLSGWRGVRIRGKVCINCDMGEGMDTDELIMPFISAANIACGYHAGDATTMRNTVELAMKHNVAIGAHPSFLDRENFGRKEMKLELAEVYELITQQLYILQETAVSCGAMLKHIKPHGALYNMSAKDGALANVIARAVKDFDKQLILVGLSGSYSISEAKALGLQTASEVFADRTYQNDGLLTPRSQPGALIETTDKVVAQAVQMVEQGTVTTVTGKVIPALCETICIHGDGGQAVEFAKAIYMAICK